MSASASLHRGANSSILVCPECRSRVFLTDSSAICKNCKAEYPINTDGYLDLTPRLQRGVLSSVSANPDDYTENQHLNGERLFRAFLDPLLALIRPSTVLDVGCGAGELVERLRNHGIKCFGIDLPSNTKHWAAAAADRSSLFCADARLLPFEDNSFDLVMSFGVIEHIGTINGHCTLSPTYVEDRRRYAHEIVRVTKPNGSIIIAAPNKSFPLDIQHGPTDALSPKAPLRSFICKKTGLNIHKTWGTYHLLSYREVRQLFVNHGGARSCRALPLKGYFGFGRFQRGFLRPLSMLAETYVEILPRNLLSTFLNPYVLVQITK